MNSQTVVLPRLHKAQDDVRTYESRYKVLACGRRWGKTRLGSLLCMAVALRRGRAWWVAPSYKMARPGWRGIRTLAAQIPGSEIKLGDRLVILPNGGTVQVRSADDPQSLRGEGLDFAVLDECAFMRESAWTESLRPALSDRQGGAMFISTPKGRNWFWRLWQRGQDAADLDWQSWQRPTAENPFIVPAEIEAARRDLPERIFQQEYLAMFLEDAGGVFRRVMAAATLTQQEAPTEDHQYVFGVDWGKSADFTAIAVWDVADKHLVYLDRFNQIGYGFQTKRLKMIYNRWQPTVMLCEANSMGQPLIDQLRDEGYRVRGFTTTAVTKTQIIESLSLAFERGDIEIINDPVLVGELQAYEMTRLPSGNFRYSAPEGMHDDTVMAAAIGYHGINRFVPRHAGSFQG